MATVGDTARIRPLDKSLSSELPDVDDPAALKIAAELVHKFLHTKITPASIARKRDGRPGREWQGYITREVINRIWPRMIDRVLVSEEEARTRTGALLDYMIRSEVISCLQETRGRNAAHWWVADHFTPLTISHTNPVPTQEPELAIEQVSDEIDETEIEIAEQPEADGTFPCREAECHISFTSPTGRSGHEYTQHRMVASLTGECFYYDADDFTSQYVVESIIEALRESGKPLSLYGIVAATRVKDLRLGKPVIRDHLAGIFDAGLIVKTPRGAHTYFELADKATDLTGPMAGVLSAVAEEKQRKAEEKEAQRTASPAWAPVMGKSMNSTLDYAKHVASTSMGGLKAILESIDELAGYAAEKDREIAALKMRLTMAPKANDDTVAKLKAELDEVKAERDLYKGKVEAFESALAGLRVK